MERTSGWDYANPNGLSFQFQGRQDKGTLGVASIKSTLDKRQLFDALDGLASIPPMESLEGRVPVTIYVPDYEEWPYKIIYASDGIAGGTILNHLRDYYSASPDIPITRRPNIIHVAGKYVIFRCTKKMKMQSVPLDRQSDDNRDDVGGFLLLTREPDLQAIVWVLTELQERATLSAAFLFSYGNIINRLADKFVPIGSAKSIVEADTLCTTLHVGGYHVDPQLG